MPLSHTDKAMLTYGFFDIMILVIKHYDLTLDKTLLGKSSSISKMASDEEDFAVLIISYLL